MGSPEDAQYLRLPAFLRFFVHTRTGRLAALVSVAGAVLLGGVLGVTDPPVFVQALALAISLSIAIPIVFSLAIREGRQREQQ